MNPFEGYRITSPYGWRIHPVYKDRRFHTGIDLVKNHKAPIHAFVDGIVTFVGEGSGTGFGGFGKVVAIKDKNGCLHCYCHLDSWIVKIGSQVKKGDVIGYQGNTGISTGSHLHYEIRKKAAPNNGWTDPETRCFEPTKYLQDFYAEEGKKVEQQKVEAPKANEPDSWAKEAWEWAKSKRLMDGTRPKEGITRQEVALILYRYEKNK